MKDLSFVSKEPLLKGWSADKKYCVTDENGVNYLLRVSAPDRYESRKALHALMRQVEGLGVPLCRSLDFGVTEEGVCSLQSWIDGEDAETAVPRLSPQEQYDLGVRSGEILQKIHTLPAPAGQEDWETRFTRKTRWKMDTYQACGLRFPGDRYVLEYLEDHFHLLKNRPQCFQHGDYHISNMMLSHGELVVIDFDRYDYGDPWEEFNRIVWSAQASPAFATGQLNGYFGGRPPKGFWPLLAFYICSNTLSSVYWAMSFGKSDVDTMVRQSQDVLAWYDNMKKTVPTWYRDY